MTKEEKQLLTKDLCGRLPYGIMCRIDHDPEGKYDIGIDDERFIDDRIVSVCYENEQIFVYEDEDYPYSPEEIRPYLRPMSSMTEEERKEYKDMNVLDNCDEFSNIKKNIEDIKKNGEENYIQLPRTHAQDYLNSIHVDYRGLIEKGLALEAPEGMYNI